MHSTSIIKQSSFNCSYRVLFLCSSFLFRCLKLLTTFTSGHLLKLSIATCRYIPFTGPLKSTDISFHGYSRVCLISIGGVIFLPTLAVQAEHDLTYCLTSEARFGHHIDSLKCLIIKSFPGWPS